MGCKIVNLPKIAWKRIPQYIWDGYCGLTDVDGDMEQVSKSRMYDIISSITGNDMEPASSVDYATGVLVNYNCARP